MENKYIVLIGLGMAFLLGFILICHVTGKQSNLHFYERNIGCVSAGFDYRKEGDYWVCVK